MSSQRREFGMHAALVEPQIDMANLGCFPAQLSEASGRSFRIATYNILADQYTAQEYAQKVRARPKESDNSASAGSSCSPAIAQSSDRTQSPRSLLFVVMHGTK
jgi:hypothetical protein